MLVGLGRLGVCRAKLGGRSWVRAVESLAGVLDETVERGAVVAFVALLELGVDLEGDLGVAVADLVHDPVRMPFHGLRLAWSKPRRSARKRATARQVR